MKKIYSLLTFIVCAFAAFFGAQRATASATPPPTNQATVVFENLFRSIGRHFAIASMKLQLAVDRFLGQPTFAFGLGLTETIDEKILKTLDAFNDRMKKLEEVEKAAAKNREDLDNVTKLIGEVKTELNEARKAQIPIKAMRVRSQGSAPAEVGEDCARFLGGVILAAGLRQEVFSGKNLDFAQGEVKNLLGIHGKTALTSSDIPLPVNYSGDVAELVYEYGIARRHGTVFPLSAATFKLPKLTSSPTFSLIAGSGTVTEKSPQTAWVTFSPEKFGGLVRLPTELDEDSIVALGQFLARYGARQIAQVEDYNFFRSTGAGSGQNGTAEGLTKSVVTDTMFYYNGGTSTSGKTKQSDATLADFRAMRAVHSGAVLGRAKYFVHPTYEQLFCSFNTSSTVTPYIANGANGATLDGFPIVWVPDMPAFSTSASVSLVHALFGDASFNYLGVRGGPRFDTSKEAGFTTDEILVRALERLTIGKMATDCMSGLRNSAS